MDKISPVLLFHCNNTRKPYIQSLTLWNNLGLCSVIMVSSGCVKTLAPTSPIGARISHQLWPFALFFCKNKKNDLIFSPKRALNIKIKRTTNWSNAYLETKLHLCIVWHVSYLKSLWKTGSCPYSCSPPSENNSKKIQIMITSIEWDQIWPRSVLPGP